MSKAEVLKRRARILLLVGLLGFIFGIVVSIIAYNINQAFSNFFIIVAFAMLAISFLGLIGCLQQSDRDPVEFKPLLDMLRSLKTYLLVI